MAAPEPSGSKYEDVILRREFERWWACEDPKAWAQYRDMVSKSLDWFYSLEAGVCMNTVDPKHRLYSATQYVTGILINGAPAINSYLDAEVIIVSYQKLSACLSANTIQSDFNAQDQAHAVRN